jgi:ferredoxin
MDIFTILDRLAPGEQPSIKLDSEACFHSIFRYSACSECFEICPVGAIQPNKPPVFEENKCVSCMACLPACPAGAYSAKDALPGLLNCCNQLKTASIELICEKHLQNQVGLDASNTAIQLRGCLAGLGPGAFMLLATFGFEKVILRTDACADCSWGSLRSEIVKDVSQAQQYLNTWGLADSISVSDRKTGLVERPVWEADHPPISRRDLFHLASQEGQSVIGRALVGGQQPSKDKLPRNRRQVLNAISVLNARAGKDNPTLTGLGYALVSISEACTACGICARVCPTRALQFEKQTEYKYRLLFTPETCVACEACYHVCTPKAITIDHAPAFRDVFGLPEAVIARAGEFTRCERCDIPFAGPPSHRFCPVCESIL